MSELSNEFQKMMDDLENNLENKKDVEYVRKAVTDFFEKVEENVEGRMKVIEDRMNKVDDTLNKMQEEFYLDDEFEEDDILEIACPYCNHVFETEINESKTELQCPECNNIIELDWNCCDDEDDECGAGGCSHCHGCEHEDFEDDDM